MDEKKYVVRVPFHVTVAVTVRAKNETEATILGVSEARLVLCSDCEKRVREEDDLLMEKDPIVELIAD